MRRAKLRSGFGWLEWLLVLAGVSLFFQLFPQVWTGLIHACDVRNWGRLAWFIANLVLVAFLVGIAYGTRMQVAWAEHRTAAAKKRADAAKKRDERDEKKKRTECKKRVEEIRKWQRKH